MVHYWPMTATSGRAAVSLPIPPIPCPFPSEINPHVDEVERESFAWLCASGMLARRRDASNGTGGPGSVISPPAPTRGWTGRCSGWSPTGACGCSPSTTASASRYGTAAAPACSYASCRSCCGSSTTSAPPDAVPLALRPHAAGDQGPGRRARPPRPARPVVRRHQRLPLRPGVGGRQPGGRRRAHRRGLRLHAPPYRRHAPGVHADRHRRPASTSPRSSGRTRTCASSPSSATTWWSGTTTSSPTPRSSGTTGPGTTWSTCWSAHRGHTEQEALEEVLAMHNRAIDRMVELDGPVRGLGAARGDRLRAGPGALGERPHRLRPRQLPLHGDPDRAGSPRRDAGRR